eukprot:Nitzschia sp. Nitz4//scaffold18_size181773//101213//102835//NITZ4_001924-RA/size181773-processed-gene-0.55-mRNA-1//-1//CDS//3329540038//9047//frame0
MRKHYQNKFRKLRLDDVEDDDNIATFEIEQSRFSDADDVDEDYDGFYRYLPELQSHRWTYLFALIPLILLWYVWKVTRESSLDNSLVQGLDDGSDSATTIDGIPLTGLWIYVKNWPEDSSDIILWKDRWVILANFIVMAKRLNAVLVLPRAHDGQWVNCDAVPSVLASDFLDINRLTTYYPYLADCHQFHKAKNHLAGPKVHEVCLLPEAGTCSGNGKKGTFTMEHFQSEELNEGIAASKDDPKSLVVLELRMDLKSSALTENELTSVQYDLNRMYETLIVITGRRQKFVMDMGEARKVVEKYFRLADILYNQLDDILLEQGAYSYENTTMSSKYDYIAVQWDGDAHTALDGELLGECASKLLQTKEAVVDYATAMSLEHTKVFLVSRPSWQSTILHLGQKNDASSLNNASSSFHELSIMGQSTGASYLSWTNPPLSTWKKEPEMFQEVMNLLMVHRATSFVTCLDSCSKSARYKFCSSCNNAMSEGEEGALFAHNALDIRKRWDLPHDGRRSTRRKRSVDALSCWPKDSSQVKKLDKLN